MKGMVYVDDERRLGQPFDSLDEFDLFGIAERQGRAVAAGAGSASDAVYVAFGIPGHFIVDDVGNAINIDTAGGDIGGDQRLDVASIEGLEGRLSGALTFVRMHHIDFDAAFAKLPRQAVGAMFCARKHESPTRFYVFEYRRQQITLVLLGDKENFLRDVV